MGMRLKPKAFLSLAGVVLLFGMGTAPAGAQQFTDVSAELAELGPAYLRDGVRMPIENLRRVEQGSGQLAKPEVEALLGAPNDMASSRESDNWLFNINLPLGERDYLVCQYRVAFAQNTVANVQWRRPQCEARYRELSVPQEYSLSADLLFGFDSASISSEGQRAIQQIASEVRQNFQTPTVTVVGYSDRIGAANYNLQLSERRAEAVATALINGGVDRSWVRYEGRGQANPIVECSGITGNQLISCLAPNRRVDVSLYEQF
ncbi:OmpA family protein [Halomonas dongshanensis]|uniref:OmpA family protein n=1 Tax=Halomonas dongshanensis TaxID=2890835 RepID=A0ABT2EH71_9GAMM|nr:OmpA family protein [Halomonas dongshanensis]MCS2610911.1 OmpA family protein [Halomonas dongshanensis]